MRCNLSLAVVVIIAAIVSECMTLPGAEAIRTSVSTSVWWETKEFWRTTVVPLWNWKKNVRADEGDVPDWRSPQVDTSDRGEMPSPREELKSRAIHEATTENASLHFDLSTAASPKPTNQRS